MKNSLLTPFLINQINKFPAFFENYLNQKFESPSRSIFCGQGGHAGPPLQEQNLPALKKIFRDFRNQEISLIALRDLNTDQTVVETCAQLSELAEWILKQALDCLQKINNSNFDLDILAMGKLGGHELNFSSDIDLIFVLFLPDQASDQPADQLHDLSIIPRVTALLQNLINLLDTPTEDGRVYRVDMRLRPFGKSGPLVMTDQQLLNYYKNHGRDWERYALIKSRFLIKPQQENRVLCEKNLQNFIYQKDQNLGVDYAIPEIILNIYRAIQKEQKEQKNLNFLNIKLAEGGIREAEFIVQSLQLMHAGQGKILRRRSYIKALMALASQKVLTDQQASVLEESYCFLRDLENKLQMISDQQTHAYPVCISQLKEDLAALMGEKSVQDLDQKVSFYRDKIIQARKNFLENKNNLAISAGPRVASISPMKIIKRPEDDTSHWPELKTWSEPQVLNYFEGIKSTDPRCAFLLNQLKNPVLEALDNLENLEGKANFKLARTIILDLLDLIKDKKSYLSLLVANTRQISRLLYFLTQSHFLKNLVFQCPGLLPLFWVQGESQPRSKSELKQYLDQHLQGLENLNLKLEYLKEQRLFQLCRIALSDLENQYPIMRISDFLTELAEVMVDISCELAWHEMIEHFGFPAGIQSGKDPGFAVIAYGKLGGLELSYTSDLDLVFIYQYAEGVSSGERGLLQEEFYSKLTQKFLGFLQDLYFIDLRLRPNGHSGLLACSIQTFSHYQHESAWTWEHQALLKARPIFSNLDLNAHFEQIRLDILCLKRDKEFLKKEVLNMREKMRDNKLKKEGNRESDLDLKQTQGGLIDIEFLVQYLALLYAHQYPVLVRYTDNIRILESLCVQEILSKEESDFLIETYRQYRNFLHREFLLGPSENLFQAQRARVWDLFHRYLSSLPRASN